MTRIWVRVRAALALGALFVVMSFAGAVPAFAVGTPTIERPIENGTVGPKYSVTGTVGGGPNGNPGGTVTVYEKLGSTRNTATDKVYGTTHIYFVDTDGNTQPDAGRWALPVTFTGGPHTIYAEAKDNTGAMMQSSPDRKFIVDATAPVPPSIRQPAAGAKLKNSWVNMYGTAEPNSTVRVCEGTTCTAASTIATTLTSPYGDWSVARPFADGEHTIVATAKDQYGNESSDSAPVSFSVDANAPAPPVITSPTEGSTVVPPVSIVGTAEPGSTVTVSEGASELGTAEVDDAGDWSLDPLALDDGPHTITATATDAAEHQSEPATVSFTVDSDPDLEAPAPPVITAPAEGLAHGPSVTVSGTAEAGSTVEVFEGSESKGSTTAGEDGAWSLDATFATGEHTITATATDTAGNDSLPSDAVTFTVDADVPVAQITAPMDNAVFQPDTPVTVTGTASDNVAVQSVVVIFKDVAGNPTTVPATYTPGAEAGTGTWSATAANLPVGRYEVTARATDGVGNVGTSTAVNIVVLSTTAPSPSPISPPAVPSPTPPPS